MNIVVYESIISGHRGEYISHLIRFSKRLADNCTIYFVVSSSFEEKFEDVAGIAKNDPRQHIINLPEGYSDSLQSLSLRRRSLKEWETMTEHAKKVGADHCILLNLNVFQYAIGKRAWKSSSMSISGILFHPFVRAEMKTKNGFSDWWAARLSYARKYAQMIWMMQNAQLHQIHVLNDEKAATALNKKIGLKSIFSPLPDPVPDWEANREVDLRKKYSIDSASTLFLLFGSLRQSKGVFQAVRAFSKLDEEARANSTLLMIGGVKEQIRNQLLEEVRLAQRTSNVILDEGFVPERNVRPTFKQSDVVLLPYQRTEGSTGVLGHAAHAQKPVIGPETGLIGELIRTYNLGTTTACDQPARLSSSMKAAVKHGIEVDSKRQREYVQSRSPHAFSEKLIPAECI